jgi:hypothetical protein
MVDDDDNDDVVFDDVNDVDVDFVVDPVVDARLDDDDGY